VLPATIDPLDQFLNASTLTLPSPRAEVSLLFKGGCSPSRHPRVAIAIFTRTNGDHQIVMLMSLNPFVQCRKANAQI
jgi:hypothetical protein